MKSKTREKGDVTLPGDSRSPPATLTGYQFDFFCFCFFLLYVRIARFIILFHVVVFPSFLRVLFRLTYMTSCSFSSFVTSCFILLCIFSDTTRRTKDTFLLLAYLPLALHHPLTSSHQTNSPATLLCVLSSH